jgi:hypothetical protein
VPDGLHQGERRDRVGTIDLLQHVERVVEKLGLRAGPEDARVVDQSIKAAGIPRGAGERPAVILAPYVAGDGDDVGRAG